MSMSIAPLKELHKNIIWPAVAGNVAWSFLTVMMSARVDGDHYVARMAVLGLMTIYLFHSWRHLAVNRDDGIYYVLDTLYAISIAMFSVAMSSLHTALSGFAIFAIVAMFTILAVGHAFGRWYDVHRFRCRMILSGLNLAALVFVLYQRYALETVLIWSMVGSLAVILLAWFVVFKWCPPSAGNVVPPERT